jgi:hypothetical protein
VQKNLKSKMLMLDGHWWLMLILLATQQAEIRRTEVRGQPMYIVCGTLSQNTQHIKKRAGGVAQEVQHLPSKYEALNSNPNMTKKKLKSRRTEFESAPSSFFFFCSAGV